ncbi:hypothetical protein GCM10007377_02430 [Galliscardovia ingluviei]|uniref:LytR/CpsA/Psr regulator C-terminal domain-containing protein n=1 Tax=Galliscardovia ingluviei TaxID=1769422 RepID=A0A8J3AE91_9BIFI|nr:LytR C-terminal domain-containing protein [Galliscardovia ingluviei]GGI12732.1 hypothetical protein GCM10007377_02430 [Galliscardovia ingluviei]
MSDYQHSNGRPDVEDEFENPQPGPAGLHRGQRGVMTRVAPYLVVLIVAALCGLGAFIWLSGFGGQQPTRFNATTAQSTTSSNKDSKKKDTQQTTDTSDTSKSSEEKKSTENSSTSDDTQQTDATNSANATDANNQSHQEQSQNQPQQQSVNRAIAITVYNGTGINGYAAQHASTLTSSGYTSVTPKNPNNAATLPQVSTVWYENESDRATAEDVAKQLGISQVTQANGLETPVAVALMQ